MTASDRNPLNSLRVTCPTCHERLEVGLKEKAQTLACTFCKARLSIPTREQAQRQWEAQRPSSAPVVEEYKIATPADASTSTPRSKKGAGKSADGGPIKSPAPQLVVVMCPTCHERMRAPVEDSPGKAACTFCGAAIPVPGRAAVERWKAKQIQPQAKERIGEYAAAAPCERPAPGMHLFDRLAEIRREAPIPPPRWTFFSGVFSFPWRTETLFPWTAMSLGFTILALGLGFIALIGGFIAGGGGEGADTRGFGIIGLGFFALPLLWIAIFTFAYTASCCLCVIESTAYGHDQIEAWPEGGWKEWMPQLIYLGWIAALPTVVSAGAGRLAELGGIPFWPAMLGVLFLLYPIALLSALEANSAWVPVTWAIIKTLYFACSGWLLFYLLTGLMVIGLAALVAGFAKFGFLVMVPLGPLLGAFFLIYARLLGRLALKIGQVLTA